MKKICLGDLYEIHCYKHDGNIHRAWDEAVVLDIKKDYMVFGNNKTKVTEAEGITWRTKEPAIMYFFKDRWYNIIVQMKKDGIYYYCNIATPFILEEGKIKYIDYDLDLRIFPKGDFRILDKLEYEYHKKKMHYSKDLDKVLREELTVLIDKVRVKDYPFNLKSIDKYFKEYADIKKIKNIKSLV